MANKIRKKDFVTQEMDLKPFMNLMVVLIPLLLLSAEFAKIAVIEINLPEKRGSQTRQTVKERSKEELSNKLLLTAIITDSVITLGAKSGFLPSIYYKEYHHYVATGDQADFTVEYDFNDKEPAKHPKSGRPMKKSERYEIFLYVTDENHEEIKKAYYTEYGELITDSDNKPLNEIAAGDTVYTLTNPRRMVVVSSKEDFQLRQLSAYDVLKNRLMIIRERYKDAEDENEIIIAAENYVLYDKIVQIMDAARSADFPKISIAKLRAS